MGATAVSLNCRATIGKNRVLSRTMQVMPTPEEGIVMSYRITGLDPTPFRNLFGLSDEKLGRLSVKRVVADAKPGLPPDASAGRDRGHTLRLRTTTSGGGRWRRPIPA